MNRNTLGENAQNYDKVLSHKILTRAEEIALIARLDQAWPDRHTDDNWRTPPPEAAKVICEIVSHNYRLLAKFAFKHCDRGLDFDDLFQEGYFGMVRAIIKFESTKKVRLSTYLTWWIKQALDRAVMTHKRNIRVSIHTQYEHQRIKRLLAEAEIGGGEIDRDTIAGKLGLEPGQVDDILSLVGRANTLSLDEPQFAFDDGDQSLLQDIIEDEQPSHLEMVADKELAEAIRVSLDTLSPREVKVLSLRYGLDDGCPRTLEECGQMFGLTRERIRQIEAEALRKLRHPKRSRMLREFAND